MNQSCLPEHGWFNCVSNGIKKCMPINRACDGYEDCEGGIDEGGLCSKTIFRLNLPFDLNQFIFIKILLWIVRRILNVLMNATRRLRAPFVPAQQVYNSSTEVLVLVRLLLWCVLLRFHHNQSSLSLQILTNVRSNLLYAVNNVRTPKEVSNVRVEVAICWILSTRRHVWEMVGLRFLFKD